MLPCPVSSLFFSLEGGTRVLEAARLSKTVAVEPLHPVVASVQGSVPTVSAQNGTLISGASRGSLRGP